MAFRILDQNPVYVDDYGNPCAGGSLSFFANVTSSPTVTYSDPALTISNGAYVTLNSSARAPVDMWSGVPIRVQLKNSAGTVIWTKDDVSSGAALPALISSGYLYSPDGITLASATIRQVPDPATFSGKYLKTTDGVTWTWAGIDLSNGAGGNLGNYLQKNMREVQQSVTAVAATPIDWSLGGVVALAQAVDITSWVMTGLAAAGQAQVLTIIRKKDNTATARAITWPAGVKWPSGIAPTLTATANGVDIFTFITYDAGVTYYGSYVTGMA